VVDPQRVRRQDNDRLRRESQRLERENASLRRENEGLKRTVEAQRKELARMRGKLLKSNRRRKRQAAPFSKGEPKKKPKRPGRKPGKGYGTKARRPIPGHVDEVIPVGLPSRCPHCQAASVAYQKTASQYQEEIPKVQTFVRRFDIDMGHCLECGRSVRGRHPLQTSEALGAAGVTVGPEALGLAAHLNKVLGVSYGKVQHFLHHTFSLDISRGGISQGFDRMANRLMPTYEASVRHIQCSPIVCPDETGWRVGGRSAWLWVFVTPKLTVYRIMGGRSYEDACAVLGAEYSGTIVRDGWAPYRSFEHATHQTCVGGHLIRRCKELLEVAQRGAARVPHAVLRILHRALAMRDRWLLQPPSDHGRAVHVGRITAEMDRLLTWRPKDEENRKLLKHLRNERDALFTFLRNPSVPASNYWAEQAIRPAVVTRKVWGGNRTPSGAVTQSVLQSFFRSCRQQQVNPTTIISDILRSPTPIVAPFPCFAEGPRAARPPTVGM